MFPPLFPIYISALVPFYDYGTLIWLAGIVCLWLLSILEDRELAAHFGTQYEEYARRVPRLFPN
jgi:protein-S-isoprenylcysteine O-methyltransferase Ste14